MTRLVKPVASALSVPRACSWGAAAGGGVPYDAGRRGPIEIICAMAELGFARRIPSDPRLAKVAEGRIDEWSTSGETVWSDEATWPQSRRRRSKRRRCEGTELRTR